MGKSEGNKRMWSIGIRPESPSSNSTLTAADLGLGSLSSEAGKENDIVIK